MRKGVSPIIATVILISIVVIIAAVVGPWAFQMAQQSTNQTGTQIDRELLCRNVMYDFVPDFGKDGIEYDFSGTQSQDYLRTMIRNQGNINIFGFSFEAIINSTVGIEIKRLKVADFSQKTKDDPLKPGETAILRAEITEDIEGDLKKLTVLNGYDCPPLSKDI